MTHQIIKILKQTQKESSDKEDWKTFEQNNKEIVLNVLFVLYNKKEKE